MAKTDLDRLVEFAATEKPLLLGQIDAIVKAEKDRTQLLPMHPRSLGSLGDIRKTLSLHDHAQERMKNTLSPMQQQIQEAMKSAANPFGQQFHQAIQDAMSSTRELQQLIRDSMSPLQQLQLSIGNSLSPLMQIQETMKGIEDPTRQIQRSIAMDIKAAMEKSFTLSDATKAAMDARLSEADQEEEAQLAAAPQQPARPSLDGLMKFNDLLTSPQLRKRLKKMMADQAVHIADLCEAGRYKDAKWIELSTWGLWFWYVLKSPLSSLLSAAKRAAG